MKIIFGLVFLGSLGMTIYFKYKLNRAYDCICYLDSKLRKRNPISQRNKALLIKLKDLVDDYKHERNVFEVMREISETINKIELDSNQTN